MSEKQLAAEKQLAGEEQFAAEKQLAGEEQLVAGEQLATGRADTVRRIAALRGDVTSILDSASSTTGDDEHDPEGATIGFERAQAQALLDQAVAHLADIEAAVARLADGSYGHCLGCGGAITPARLDARPEAALCITCASRP